MSELFDPAAFTLERFSAIREWDIDLLLLEELNCNSSFAQWLYDSVRIQSKRVILPLSNNLVCLSRHSVSYSGDGSGESDIEASFLINRSEGDAKILFLIEDKVGAAFTELQPERYLTRCASLSREKGYDFAVCVLIAPQDYLDSAPTTCFDAQVSYEQVIDHLGSFRAVPEKDQIARREHRTLMIRHALERYRRGGNRVNDESRTLFFDEYFQLAQRRQPKLQQKRARPRSVGCRKFYYEVNPRISRGVKELFIEHQPDRDFVTIKFAGWGKNWDWYVPRLEHVITDPAMVVDAPHNREYVQVKISVLPRLQLDRPVREQEEAAHAAFDAAAALLNWYQKNYSQFEQWVREMPSPS